MTVSDQFSTLNFVSIGITVITGTLVFILGQWALKSVIEPVQELKKAIGRVSAFLLKNQGEIANEISSPEISIAARTLASELISYQTVIPTYGAVRFLFGLPKFESIIKAAQDLNLVCGFMNPGTHKSSKFLRSKESNLSKSILEIGKELNISTTFDKSQLLSTSEKDR